MKNSRIVKTVMLENVSEKELVLRTNASKIVPILLIVSTILLVIISASVGRAGGGLGSAATFEIGLICFFMLAAALFIPVKVVFGFNQENDSFLYQKSFLTSSLGFPKINIKRYKLSETAIGKIDRIKIHTWRIKVGQREYVLNMENVYPHLERSESPLVKVDEFLFGETQEISETLESSDADLEEISDDLSQASEAESKKFHMQNEIHSWGRSSIILGVIHLISFGLLAPSWGVILLLVGIASFKIVDPAMFVVYGISLAWVGLNNAIYSDLGLWTIFGLYQIYLAYRVYKKYNFYKGDQQVEEPGQQDEGQLENLNKASRYFTNTGCWLSAVSFIVFVGFFVYVLFTVAISAYTGQDTTLNNEGFYTIVLDVTVGLGVIGFAASLAALLSKFKPAWKAWVGIICSGLLMVMNFGLILI